MNNQRICNLAQPNGDKHPASKICTVITFLNTSSGVMAGWQS